MGCTVWLSAWAKKNALKLLLALLSTDELTFVTPVGGSEFSKDGITEKFDPDLGLGGNLEGISPPAWLMDLHWHGTARQGAGCQLIETVMLERTRSQANS